MPELTNHVERVHPNDALLIWVLWKTRGAEPITITAADAQACRQAFQPGGPWLLRRDVGTAVEVRVTSREDARAQMQYSTVMDRIKNAQGTSVATKAWGPSMIRHIADPQVRAVVMCLDVLLRMDPGTVAAHALPQCTDDEFDDAVKEAAGFLWGPRRDGWPADVRTVLVRSAARP